MEAGIGFACKWQLWVPRGSCWAHLSSRRSDLNPVSPSSVAAAKPGVGKYSDYISKREIPFFSVKIMHRPWVFFIFCSHLQSGQFFCQKLVPCSSIPQFSHLFALSFQFFLSFILMFKPMYFGLWQQQSLELENKGFSKREIPGFFSVKIMHRPWVFGIFAVTHTVLIIFCQKIVPGEFLNFHTSLRSLFSFPLQFRPMYIGLRMQQSLEGNWKI